VKIVTYMTRSTMTSAIPT